jgi:hypothetical protein
MKNRFILTEEEKKSILGLYNKNILSEQQAPTTIDEIKKFQDYMDTLGPWVKKTDGKYYKLNKGGGYGNFGANTQAAWKVYGQKYLESSGGGSVASAGGAGSTSILDETKIENSSLGGDCVRVEVTGEFAVGVADNPQNVENFIARFIKVINSNPLLSDSYKANTLYVGGIKLLGGASNRYKGTVMPDVDNNLKPVKLNPANYTGNYAANKYLAKQRAENLFKELLVRLPKSNIKFGENITPTYESVIVDTGGNVDTARGTKYKNPGQIVKCFVDICGVKGVTGGTINQQEQEEVKTEPDNKPVESQITTKTQEVVKECFENAEIEVNYVGTGHKCNYAIYEIYVNGIKIKRETGQDYASLNNAGDFDDAEKQGEQRFNKFIITKITAQEFVNVNNLSKYQGNLQIDAKCILKNPKLEKGWPDPDNNGTPNGGCHKGVGKVIARVNGKEFEKEARTPNKYGESIMLANFAACKSLYEKSIQNAADATKQDDNLT